MAKILVSPQKVFASSVPAAGNIAKFGSLAAAAPAYSTDPAVIQALAAFVQGWQSATVGNSSPALQDRNALDFLFSRQIAQIQQAGLSDWNADVNYQLGAWVQDSTSGQEGVAYVSQHADNLTHPLTDTNWWLPLSQVISNAVVPRQQLLKAWIVFNGQGAVSIYDTYGCSVARVAVGVYDITFTPPLDFANYGYNLSLTQENGIQACVLATRFPGDTKNVNTLRMRTVSCVDSSGFDCPEVSVSIFSS